jgi:hypothetical protein
MIGRIRRAVWSLAPEQRLAGVAALLLFASMFLPWYTRKTIARGPEGLVRDDTTLQAFQSFSFVELAILLVAVGVLALVFARGEGRGFHLPFGDGPVITAAGLWVCFLVFYRFVDNKNGDSDQFVSVDYGITWGIFVTFLIGLLLAYSGVKVRAAHLVEPPSPADTRPPRPGEEDWETAVAPTTPVRPRRKPVDPLRYDDQA